MRARRLSALAVGAFATLGAVPYMAAPAQAAAANDAATELVVDSAASSMLFHGVSGVWTPPGQPVSVGGGDHNFGFIIDNVPNGQAQPVTVRVDLTLYNGQQVTEGATYAGTDSPKPVMSFTAGYGACDEQGSRIKVEQYKITDGQISNAQIEFWTNCGGPLHGLIRYNAGVPLPDGAPTGTPIIGAPGVPLGSVAPISFKRGGALIANPGRGVDGTVVARVREADTGIPLQTWSPLGSRLFFFDGGGLSSVRPDGTAPIRVSTAADGEAAISPDGSTAVMTAQYVYAAPSDGSGATSTADSRIPIPDPTGGPSGATPFEHPHFQRDGSLLLTGTDRASQVRNLYRSANGATKLLIANADWGTPSPDGTRIAFVRTDSAGVHQIFVVGADGGTGLTQLTHGSEDISEPSWSPDGKYLAYSDGTYRGVVEINAVSGAPVGSIPNATSPVWTPPVTDSHVIREWGADRVSTAVAASQINFADHGDAADRRRGQAGAVVLSRSDTFADALGGSALAVRKDAPLLITGSGALDPAVKREIGRVLAPGGTVYLLGGNAALAPAVATALSGYHVVRLAGDNRYDTAVKIAKQMGGTPRTVTVATGDNYPDALAAGATGQPVLLTSGSAMPKETAAYLNTLNPDGRAADGTEIVTIGGPGDAALHAAYLGGKLPSWPSSISRVKLTGKDRYATALLVAQAFFSSNSDAALATGATWPDALSGGAMVGHRGGPLLLTDPSGLSSDVLSYLGSQSASLFALHLLGGTAALPDAIARQGAGVIGVPGHVRIDGYTPGSVYPYAGKTSDTAGEKSVRSAHVDTMRREG